MDEELAKQIIDELGQMVKKLAKQNGLLWFYQMHQLAVIKSAESLLAIYPKANHPLVIIACWLHDVAQYFAKDSNFDKVKKNHHLASAKLAKEILADYKIGEAEKEQIVNCVLNHRNLEGCQPKTLEEKIVAVADTLSHFEGIFYLTYFKFHPKHSLEEMAENDLAKLQRDWRDLGLLTKARVLAKPRYVILKNMLQDFQKN
jgi:HD superfamily phosphodiesterase